MNEASRHTYGGSAENQDGEKVFFGLWLSVGTGIVAAATFGYFSIVASGTTLDISQIGIASISIGLVLALIHWIIFNLYKSELRRVIAHTESLVEVERSEAHGETYRPKLGLMAVVESVDQAFEGLRQRMERMVRQRRELEVQVRVSDAARRHAEAILGSISDAVIVTDEFNEVVLANETAADIFQFELATSLRKPLEQVVSDPTLIKLIRDTREDDALVHRRKVEHHINHHGVTKFYETALSSLVGSATERGKTSGVVTVLRDITQEKKIAETKNDFVSNVSHELRTPLSSIKAYMEMLVDGEANDEQTRSEFYNIIQGETNRLSRLIDNVLNISRIESGVVRVQREHISLYGLIKEAVEVIKPQARAKNVELIFTCQVLLVQVFADGDMIYQAVINLVSNALKYTPSRGRVTVSMDVDQHRQIVKVNVTDTGVGIPEEDLPHLFEKFYRVKDHKNLAKGTGLGLNLVKHIIDTVHAGSVKVTSRVGMGSTFAFTLPLVSYEHLEQGP